MIEFPETIVCKWCDRQMDNDPGAYYHQAACEEQWCTERISREAAR